MRSAPGTEGALPKNWLPLAEAATRCRASGSAAECALYEILQSGRVPVRGKRHGRVQAEPIAHILHRMRHPKGTVRFTPTINEIIVWVDLSRLSDPSLTAAIEMGRGWVPPVVIFSGVMVNWPKLVEELRVSAEVEHDQAHSLIRRLGNTGERIGKSKPRRGPIPGTVDRYGSADRALFSEIKKRMKDGSQSLTAVTQELAEEGKVAGAGGRASKATRLAKLYRTEKGPH
jgi:hypothetical protein